MFKFHIYYIWLIFAPIVLANDKQKAEKQESFSLISVDWEEIENAYIVTLWFLLAVIAKILFNLNKKFGEAVPDSACLIVVGLIVGSILSLTRIDKSHYELTWNIFFVFLLPPIIFDAGYFMPNRQLFENFDSVMVFAFIGTIFNSFAIGSTLYGCSQLNIFHYKLEFCEALIFSSLISSVDPVAVIAVFEEVHVNEFLFINVFGEALFNDGAAVVMYQLFSQFVKIEKLSVKDYVLGSLSMVVVPLGGIFIGIVFALLVSFITKYTKRIKILAPLLVFAFPYLAYLTGEMLNVSSIFAIIVCAMFMKQYIKQNLTPEAGTSVKYFIKLAAQGSETVVFMFLGFSAVERKPTWDSADKEKATWDIAFIAITIASCLVYRTIGIIVQCAILNRFRTKQFTKVDQFVLSYGGLRGAIAFGLATTMPNIPAKEMFITTTIAVIYFTVFVQGITIKPILNWLKVEKSEDKEANMMENVYNCYFDHTMAGIEKIVGRKGKNSIRQWYERFNAKVLKPILIKSYKNRIFEAGQIVRAYNKITLQEAMEVAHQGQLHPVPSDAEMAEKEKVPTAAEMTTIYEMFSQLLNRKIGEIEQPGDESDIDELVEGHDIADDYIGMMKPRPQDDFDEPISPVKRHRTERYSRRNGRSNNMPVFNRMSTKF